MSLSKQLLILISALFLMIFSLNFLLSVNNIRSYLEGESQIHAQDTATSLGLSLSPYMVEETDPIIETTMNAIFDMGYYQEIILVNVENQPLVTLTNKKEFEGVPDWFVEMISMKTAMAESEISTGWSISGVIYVTINSGYAYLKLYEQVRSSFYYSLAAFVLSIALLLVVLRFTLSSLKRIDQMALTIARGRFETIEHLPWTTEVRNVTASMNIMSRKIEGAIRNLNIKLDNIGKKLQQDDLTRLYKKSSFDIDMKNLFFTHDIEAFIFMIKVDGLANLVKELDNDMVDQFLKDFAWVLTDVSEQCVDAEITAYHFYGSEFALLVKQVNFKQTEDIAKLLSRSLAELGEKYKKPDISHIGVAPFNLFATTDDILLAANEAYDQAQLIGANSYFIRTSEDRAKDLAEWKSLVFNVVDKHDYRVSFVDQMESFKTERLLMEEAFTQAVDKKGDLISIGTFISIAEKFEKIVDLDKGITLQVVEYIKANKIQHAVAINLSGRTIKSRGFRSWLAYLINQNPSISQQLVFSISAYAVAKEVGIYKEFIDFVHRLNAKVLIKGFETQSMSPEVAKELNPDFIRLARDIGNGIATDAGKKVFVETMQEIAELLDISVLAENVHAEDDFTCLKAIGIAAASR